MTKTIYIGSYYEYQIVETLTSTVATTQTYYFAGSTRVAMRDNSTLIFLLSDHLGSTSMTTDASGGLLSAQKYLPYGEVRGVGGLETDYTYTGQRTAAAGLMFYNARFYDPALSHFIEADTIIPEAVQGVMAWNRYAYVNYSAVNYADPSGHCILLCIALPALILSGAAIGGGTYAYTHQGDNFDKGEFAIASLTGAAAGAMAFVGVGAVVGGASAAFSAAFIGGAVGASATQVGYTLGSGENYQTDAMLVNTILGSATGMASGALGASMSGAFAPLGKGLLNGTLNVGQEVGSNMMLNKETGMTSIGTSFQIGFLGGAVGGVLDEIGVAGKSWLNQKGAFEHATFNGLDALRSVSLPTPTLSQTMGIGFSKLGQGVISGSSDYTFTFWDSMRTSD